MGRAGDAIFVLRMSALAAVFGIVSVPFLGVITAQEDFLAPAVVDIGLGLVRVGLVVLLCQYGEDKLRLYSVLMMCLAFGAALAYVTYCVKKYGELVHLRFRREWANYREMFHYSGWILLGGCACIAQTNGTALLVNSFFGVRLNAALGVAGQVQHIVQVFARSVGQAAVPQITKSYSAGNPDRTMQLVCYISKHSFFLMLLPVLPILLETSVLLRLWLQEVPAYASVFCQLMVVAGLVDCLGAGIPSAIGATGRVKYFAIWMSAVSLAGLPVAYLLLRQGCPPYAILVTFIVTGMINAVVRQVLLKRLIRFDVKQFIRISYLRILYVILALSPLFALRSLYPDGVRRCLVLCPTAVVWLLASVYLVGLERSERAAIRLKLKYVFARLLAGKQYVR
jgi:O-antigen/teichoic acid export membrane protein